MTPNSVRAQRVSRGYSDSSPDFSSSRLVGASARGKSVERNNGSGDVGSLRRSEWISSRAQSVEPSALGVQLKQRGRSAARSGASSGASSRLTTQPTPGGFASKHRRSSLASPKPSAEKFEDVHQR